MNDREMLLQHRTWLLEVVIPGYQRARPGDHESIRRSMVQVMDIDYLLETDPPRKPLNVMHNKPYRDRQITLPVRRNKTSETNESYRLSSEDETKGCNDD